MPVAVVEVNLPGWVAAVDKLYQKSVKMIAKPRHANYALPLQVMLLGISKKDIFLSRFPLLLEQCVLRLKDKAYKNVAIMCIIKLLWVYLNRSSEAISATHKRLDQLFKLIIPFGKRSFFPQDVMPELVIRLLVMVGCKFHDYAAKSLLSPLLSIDATVLSIETMSTERVIAALRTYAILCAAPVSSTPAYTQDMTYPSGHIMQAQGDKIINNYAVPQLLRVNDVTVINARFKPLMPIYTTQLYKAVMLADSHVGNLLLTDDKFSSK